MGFISSIDVKKIEFGGCSQRACLWLSPMVVMSDHKCSTILGVIKTAPGVLFFFLVVSLMKITVDKLQCRQWMIVSTCILLSLHDADCQRCEPSLLHCSLAERIWNAISPLFYTGSCQNLLKRFLRVGGLGSKQGEAESFATVPLLQYDVLFSGEE